MIWDIKQLKKVVNYIDRHYDVKYLYSFSIDENKASFSTKDGDYYLWSDLVQIYLDLK